MQPRTLLVMLVLILGLGGFIFFYEKDLPSTDERAEMDKKVLPVEADEVSALTLEWQGEKVRLERDPPGGDDEATALRPWRLVEPLTARADRVAVDGLVSTLIGLEKRRTLEEIDRDQVGLDDPEVQVTLTTPDGDTVLRVGDQVPASSDRVVAVGSSAVYQVLGSFVADVTKAPGDWRDSQLFTGSRGDIERLTLDGAEQRVVLAKRGDEFWIESPITDRADADLVSSLLTEITGLQVKRFLDAPELAAADLGLDPAGQVLEVALTGKEEPFRLDLGLRAGDGVSEDLFPAGGAGTNPTFHGRSDGVLFEVETELADMIVRPPVVWRSRNWTGLEVFKIESARLEDGDGELRIERDGADWRKAAGEGEAERVDYSVASDLLYALTDAKADEVVERADAESRGHRFEDPVLRIELATEDGGDQLRLYEAVDGAAAATSEGREAVLLLSSGAVDEILQKVAGLKRAEPLADESGAAMADEEAAEAS